MAVWAEGWVISSRIEIQIPTIHDKSFKDMAETYHIYKHMKLKWLLITTCAYNTQSFHALVQTILSHTGCIFSQLLERVSVQILPLREKGVFLGSCGVPEGPTPNLT